MSSAEVAGRDVGATGREPVRALPARLVAPAAGRLEEARGDEPEREATRDHRPRAVAAEVLDVAQDRVAIGALEVVAERLRALRGLLSQLRRLLLALAAQVLAHAAPVAGHATDALAGLRRASVDLIAHAATGLACRLLRLVLRLLCRRVRRHVGPRRRTVRRRRLIGTQEVSSEGLGLVARAMSTRPVAASGRRCAL